MALQVVAHAGKIAAKKSHERPGGGRELRVVLGPNDEEWRDQRVSGGPLQAEVDREQPGVLGEILHPRFGAAEDPFSGLRFKGVASAGDCDLAGADGPGGEMTPAGQTGPVGRFHGTFIAPQEPRMQGRPILDGELGGGWGHE